ncbi:hypothetical protein BPORC_1110 [Bifidobacterium porcinum]|nr:hypothetical protein BPORC_1110 [Bifidobacterium porcinum]
MGKIQKPLVTSVAITAIAAVTLQLSGTSAFAANAEALEGSGTASSSVTASSSQSILDTSEGYEHSNPSANTGSYGNAESNGETGSTGVPNLQEPEKSQTPTANSGDGNGSGQVPQDDKPAVPTPEANPDAGASLQAASPRSSSAASPSKNSDGTFNTVIGQGETSKGISFSNIYRLYNPYSGEHFYTPNLDEAKKIAAVGWQWEGTAWVSSSDGTPVYRLYNPFGGIHHYTVNADERDALIKAGWRAEGASWTSDSSRAQAVYRLYNPYSGNGAHHYTRSSAERNALVKAGWQDENVSWYASGVSTQPIQPFWLVTSAWGSAKRYWVQGNTAIAKNRLITAAEGAGYLAMARQDGSVYTSPATLANGTVLLAEQNGRLCTHDTGWMVTKAYSGALHRYYVMKTAQGYSVAKTGLFVIGKASYYANPSTGIVATNQYLAYKGVWYHADSAGVLTLVRSGKIGWQNPAPYYQVSSYDVRTVGSGLFSYKQKSRLPIDATREQTTEIFIQTALSYLGTPYHWDYALQPGIGVDCAGLVQVSMESVGMQTPYNAYDHYFDPWQSHNADNMWNDPRIMKVPVNQRRRGDIILYPGHVAIYLGNDTVINAYPPARRIRQHVAMEGTRSGKAVYLTCP